MKINICDIINDIKQHPLEYITLVLAVLGATFTPGIDADLRGWGFLFWILSNGWMLVGFIRYRNIPYSILFIYYEFANIYGVYNNWVRL